MPLLGSTSLGCLDREGTARVAGTLGLGDIREKGLRETIFIFSLQVEGTVTFYYVPLHKCRNSKIEKIVSFLRASAFYLSWVLSVLELRVAAR